MLPLSLQLGAQPAQQGVAGTARANQLQRDIGGADGVEAATGNGVDQRSQFGSGSTIPAPPANRFRQLLAE
jgi:hypothetical protein